VLLLDLNNKINDLE